LPDVLRPTVQPATPLRIRVDVEAELGGDHDLIADRGEGFTDEFLVGERSVGLGGIEERDPVIRRGPDQADAVLSFRGLPVVDAQSHAAKAQGGELQVGAENAAFHRAHLRKIPLTRLRSFASREVGRGGRAGLSLEGGDGFRSGCAGLCRA
jgi:hypothetical protein